MIVKIPEYFMNYNHLYSKIRVENKGAFEFLDTKANVLGYIISVFNTIDILGKKIVSILLRLFY